MSTSALPAVGASASDLAASAATGAVAGSHVACRNCGHLFVDEVHEYCPKCGQETADHPPTVAEFLHEFVLHYIALEGKLWKTLVQLLFRPGQLTRRYLDGVKLRYVPPLRLYLTASILFFLIVKFAGAGNLFKVNSETTSTGDKVAAATEVLDAARKDMSPEDKAAFDKLFKPMVTAGPGKSQGVVLDDVKADFLSKPALEAIGCDMTTPACQKIKAYLAERYPNQTLREMGLHIRDKMLSLAPYAMFLFLPVFALLFKMMYWRRGMYYGEHLVYAFHVHAFSFFLLLILAFVPSPFSAVCSLWGIIYFWLAMRRVYGGRWWATSLRYFFISTLYPVLLVLLIAVTLLAAIFV